MAHVFISYKHEDLAFAQELALFAQSQRVPIWLDTNIQPGEEWREAIDKAIAEAFAVVVVMTPEARLSEYITYEWAFAMGLRIPVIPVLLRPTQLHPKLEVFQYLDFTRGASMQLWMKLIERLQGVQGAEPPRQTQPPAEEERMSQSVVNFFTASKVDNPVKVYVLAKEIVERLEQEENVLNLVEIEISDLMSSGGRGHYDKGYYLEYALALVKVLGLSPATLERNRIFLQMGMPDIK